MTEFDLQEFKSFKLAYSNIKNCTIKDQIHQTITEMISCLETQNYISLKICIKTYEYLRV